MKPSVPVLLRVAACAVFAAARGGEFQNLDFEGATLPTIPRDGVGSFVNVDVGLPGWNVFYAGMLAEYPSTEIRHNLVSLGGGGIFIYGPEFFDYVVDGIFTLVIHSFPVPTTFRNAISPVGRIPNDARSLVFHSGWEPALTLTFNGVRIPVHRLQRREKYFVMGANVERFAGQTGELRFTVGNDEDPVGSVSLDTIRFSTVVGEPKLFIAKSGDEVKNSWPLWAKEFDLEASSGDSAVWRKVQETSTAEGAFSTLSIIPTNAPAFFRLRRP